MPQNSSRAVGRHFLQIPGPTPLPDRVLRAMDTPIIDHRGPEFAKLAKRCLDGIKTIFKTSNPVIIYTATGTGAWEAALVNTLSAGDRVLMVETGQFATLWKLMAQKLGLRPEFIPGDWRTGADAAKIEDHLRKDKAHEIKAVCVLHNETATGCLSPIAPIHKAIDAAGHPALLMVDTISSLASTDYRHDEWGVDVTVGGAQKGLMLPPGMSFNAISDKALAAAKSSKLPKSFWAWDEMLTMNKIGFFPYTPATQMLQGLAVSIEMLHEEGLDNVFARHARLAEATRTWSDARIRSTSARWPGSANRIAMRAEESSVIRRPGRTRGCRLPPPASACGSALTVVGEPTFLPGSEFVNHSHAALACVVSLRLRNSRMVSAISR